MPVKLAFSIASCSGEVGAPGRPCPPLSRAARPSTSCPPFSFSAPSPLQDPEFPASELLQHSADSKGWCSPRCGGGGGARLPFLPHHPAFACLYPAPLASNQHCRFSQYPQELTLALEAPARLHTLQLLSHEFKIAARVELLVDEAGAGPLGADAGKPPAWRRLGFLNFDSNERSQFTARELKSVSLSGTTARFVRLLFHKCHANAANLYSQVRAGCTAGALHAVPCGSSWVLQDADAFPLAGSAAAHALRVVPTCDAPVLMPAGPTAPATCALCRSAWWPSA